MASVNPGPASTDGSTTGGLNSPISIGASNSSLISFYGVTPIVRPTSSAQAALTLTTATSGGFGFSTSAAFNSFSAQLENIRASLVLLGLLKGS
jgi:hypothetical protein